MFILLLFFTSCFPSSRACPRLYVHPVFRVARVSCLSSAVCTPGASGSRVSSFSSAVCTPRVSDPCVAYLSSGVHTPSASVPRVPLASSAVRTPRVSGSRVSRPLLSLSTSRTEKKMSVSSGEEGGQPVLHALYDQRRVSDGGTVDSFIIRDIRDRRDRARGAELETETGFFSSLVSNMRTCCAPASRKHAYGGAAGRGTAAAAAALRGGGGVGGAAANGEEQRKVWTVAGEVFGGRRVKTFSSSSSSTTSAAAAGQKEGERAHQRQAAVAEDDLRGWRGAKGAGKQQQQQQAGAGGGGPSAVLWRITDPSSINIPLTAAQASWAVIVWCVRLEYSEHMSVRMLQEILQGAEQQRRDVDITFALQNTPQFQLLLLLRRASGKTLEDLFGDFAAVLSDTCPAALAAAEDPEERQRRAAITNQAASSATYMLLVRERVVGMYVRQQGEFLDIALFDPCPPPKDSFPPSFCGFQTLEAMQQYALNAFATDPREKKAENDKIQAFFLGSKHTFTASPNARDYSTKKPIARDDWMAREALTTKDPQFEAKVMYTNMYRATDTPLADENIFALEPGMGMQIQQKAEVEANQQLKDEEAEGPEQPRGRQRGR